MFSVNQITTLGANLLAQATAANPIEYIGAVASTTDHSAAALVDMGDPSDIGWDVNGGEIVACSATDTTARIIAGFSNRASEVTVKTIGVLGRLESQSDSEAVVVAAISDDSASITIPSEDLPPVMVMAAINIQISDSSLVIVTSSTAGSAMLSDLDRLVSCHKAGQPNTGESQTIYGTKSFEDAIYATSGMVTPDLTISGEEIVWPAFSSGINTTVIGVSSGDINIRAAYGGIYALSTLNVMMGIAFKGGSFTGNFIPANDAQYNIGSSSKTINNIYAQYASINVIDVTYINGCTFEGNVQFDFPISITDGYTIEGPLSASNYPLIPDSNSTMQIGGIFLAIITASYTGNVSSGSKIPSSCTIYKAESYSAPTGSLLSPTFGTGNQLSHTGNEFVAVNGFHIDAGEQVLAFICRVSE